MFVKTINNDWINERYIKFLYTEKSSGINFEHNTFNLNAVTNDGEELTILKNKSIEEINLTINELN